VEYTFTGTPIANVKGMRVSGRTWQTAGQSKRVRVREVKVFANQNAVGRGAGKVWAKPAVFAPPKQGTPPNMCERYGIVADNCKATTYYHFGSQRVAMREQCQDRSEKSEKARNKKSTFCRAKSPFVSSYTI
jgi:hypothetical protein